MEYLWDAVSALSGQSAEVAEEQFLRKWIGVQYGTEQVESLLPLHESYFAIPYIQTMESVTSHYGEGIHHHHASSFPVWCCRR